MVTFTAHRSKPELVVPAGATPREVKSLSDVDNRPTLRLYTSIIEFYRRRVPEVPVARSIIKAALAEALVYYYPVAGRLRELPRGNKLAVDCTAEGAVFVEAHADVRLEELGQPLVPPYPCIEELLCEVGDTRDVVGKPLLYLQITELKCGGLALGFTMCHSVSDAFGMVQLFKCIIELARGQALPSILPTWKRHLLVSSSALEATSESGDHDPATMAGVDNDGKPPPQASIMIPLDVMATRSFLFGPTEIATLRSSLPARLAQSATVFELITATVWRCRTAALQHEPGEHVYAAFASNARGRWKRNPPLPARFYGNAIFRAIAEATAGELCGSSFANTVELVREAKRRLTDEYVRSVLDRIARGEKDVELALNMTFIVSDVTNCGHESLDLGWAEHVGGGATMAGDIMTRFTTFYMTGKDAAGEECVVVPMFLPEAAMERSASQIDAVTRVHQSFKSPEIAPL